MKKIKLAWVTPTTKKTSVSEFSCSVVKRLSSYATIDIVTFDDHFSEEFSDIPNKKINIKDLNLFNSLDYNYIIYNFGNNWENHGQIIRMSSRYPGVVIFHDASMHHVVAYYCFEKFKDPSLYGNIMIGEYGDLGASVLIDSEIQSNAPKYGPWDHNCGPDFGFLEFFSKGSLGYVVHSKYTLSKFNHIDVPVHLTRLPGDEKGLWDMSEIKEWQALFLKKNKINFCVMGFLNPQKNIDKAIDYIDYLTRAGLSCELLVLGGDNSNYYEIIKNYAKRKGLDGKVNFKINLNRKDFNIAKKEVDAYLSFRYPNYEGCSAAAFEAMQTGRPLITYRAGAFSDIDDDSVIFVEQSESLRNSAELLAKNFISNKEELITTGLSGRSYSLAVDSQKYANEFWLYIKSLPAVKDFKSYLPELALHESDFLLHSPKYIFFSDDPSLQLGLASVIKSFSNTFDNELVVNELKKIYTDDPLKYWNVIGLIKKIASVEFFSIDFKIFKDDLHLLFDVFKVLDLIKNDQMFEKFLSALNVPCKDDFNFRALRDRHAWCEKLKISISNKII